MICFPNAKINLGLSITEKRDDGMHNIETCYIPIPVYDILEIIQSDSFSLVQTGVQLENNSKDNLIVKAWDLISSLKKGVKPVNVYLHKNIPVGSGLGGGSSDAAFFLTSMNNMQHLGITSDELLSIASKIGADCPFFINNKPTIATGVGNIFSPTNNPVSNMFITVIFPNFSIYTNKAFSMIIPSKGNNILSTLNKQHSSWRNNLKNDFEEIIFSDFPELLNIKNTLYKLGATYTSLSGSGSAIYALSKAPLNTTALGKKYSIWSETLVLD